MKKAIVLISIAILGAGCSSQESAPMTAAENAQFKGGGPGAARTPEQQKAMGDFIAEFNKKHPSTHGGPPAGAPSGAAGPR